MFLLCLIILNCTKITSADIPSHWVSPDAWSRSNFPNGNGDASLLDCSKCPCHKQNHHDNSCDKDNQHGQFLYKKLANYILDRRQIKVSQGNSFYNTLIYYKMYLVSFSL